MASDKRKKVIFFLPSSVGGAERMTVAIAKMLDPSEYEAVFAIVGRSEGEIRHFIPSSNRVILIKVRNIYDFGFTRILRLIKKEKPYGVFSSLMYLNLRVVLAAKIAGGIRIVIRNDNSLGVAPSSVRSLLRFVYPMADTIIAQHADMARELGELKNVKAGKIVTLQNPVDTALISRSLENCQSPYPDDGCYNYVCVASICRRKAQDILIEAFRSVIESAPDSRLYLVGACGEDEYLARLKEYVRDNSLESHVIFAGYQKNPYPWMAYCNCSVLPSRAEGLPNVMIESSWLGKPLVCTNCTAVIDKIISNGQNGYVVPIDDAENLAKALVQVRELSDCKMIYKQASVDEFRALFK